MARALPSSPAEVRKLAERSQSAAQAISSLTSSSVRVAERSGELLRSLVPAIQKTAELVQEVATASREQAAGVAQVNRAMTQVDHVTQRNAAAAEQLSSTADQMADQANTLLDHMKLFRSKGADSPASWQTTDIAKATGGRILFGHADHGFAPAAYRSRFDTAPAEPMARQQRNGSMDEL